MSMDITKANENDELLLLYQPIVDLQNGRIAGCEALIRWQRSDGVIVAPSEFIPLAEENGSIIEIGQWVIETACRQMAQWNTLASRGDMQGLHEEFAVHVNLAVPQVHHPDILENLKRAVDESHIPRHKFILEITEGIVLKNTDETHATLQALTAEGFRLSIDDFGTGYSSLRYLNELPFHSFKIDKSFVSNELAGLANASIVEVLMLLSRSLDLDVVAEGIETEQQWIALRDLGCKFGQGYFFAQPLTAADLTNKLATTSYAVEQRPM
jgi:EAL domain-containing protein (putative c-di-GMP-specific phosphodiesterase class I)